MLRTSEHAPRGTPYPDTVGRRKNPSSHHVQAWHLHVARGARLPVQGQIGLKRAKKKETTQQPSRRRPACARHPHALGRRRAPPPRRRAPRGARSAHWPTGRALPVLLPEVVPFNSTRRGTCARACHARRRQRPPRGRSLSHPASRILPRLGFARNGSVTSRATVSRDRCRKFLRATALRPTGTVRLYARQHERARAERAERKRERAGEAHQRHRRSGIDKIKQRQVGSTFTFVPYDRA